MPGQKVPVKAGFPLAEAERASFDACAKRVYLILEAIDKFNRGE